MFSLILIYISAFPITLRTTFQAAEPKYIRSDPPSGVAFEVLKAIEEELEKSGIKIEWDGRYRSMEEIQRMLDACEIDLFVGMARTKERMRKYIFSIYPVYSLYHALLERRESVVKKVGVIEGTKSERKARSLMAGKEFVRFSSIGEAFEALMSGKIDGVFYNSMSLGYYQKIFGVRDSEIAYVLARKYYQFVVMSKCVPDDIVSTVNEAVEKIVKSGFVEKVLKKYGILGHVFPPNHLLFATTDRPPYEFFEGEWKGIDVEVLKRVFEKMGYKIRIERMNWARILEYIEKGIIDGTFSLTVTEDRKKYMYFSSEPISAGIDGFLYRKDRVSEKEIKVGRDLTCGYVRGYAHLDFLKSTAFRLVPIDDDESGVKVLIYGRIDLFTVNKLVGMYYASKMGKREKVAFFPAMGTEYYYVALSKIDPFHEEILREFSAELRKFKESEEYREILKKYGVDYLDLWVPTLRSF